MKIMKTCNNDNHHDTFNHDDDRLKLKNSCDDIHIIIKKFNIRIDVIDNMIEKLLNDILISDDLNDNEIHIIMVLIHNLKKTNFAGLKFLYMISFINSCKKMVDNIEGGDLKKQIIIKGLSFIITKISIDLSVHQFISWEDCDIDELLVSILNIYSEKVSYKILKSIDKNNITDVETIKDEYENNIELILKLNKSFMKVIYHYIKLTNYMTSLYLIPMLYDSNGLTINTFFRTTFLNVYSLILFNVIYKKCELKKTENDRLIEDRNIDYVFSNLDKIIEANRLNEELYNVNKKLFEYFNNHYLKKTFKFVYFTEERRNQTALYNLFETVISLIVNNTQLLLGADKFKTYFDGFSNNKTELKELLKTSESLSNVLHCKKYKMQDSIKWNSSLNIKYAFTLENVIIEQCFNNETTFSNNSNNSVVGITLNFEINKFHFMYGESGCGKTTFLKTILIKNPIKSGTLKFLGLYQNYSYLKIMKHVSLISSDAKLFSQSLYHNLTYKIKKDVLISKNDEILETILKYMTCFELEIFIPILKTKNGTKLSRGQTQKMNIIYAILNIMYANVRILLLDEATSNIDETMEVKIFTELKSLYNSHPFTCIYVSHNLSNIKFSDFNFEMSSKTKAIIKNKTPQNTKKH